MDRARDFMQRNVIFLISKRLAASQLSSIFQFQFPYNSRGPKHFHLLYISDCTVEDRDPVYSAEPVLTLVFGVRCFS